MECAGWPLLYVRTFRRFTNRTARHRLLPSRAFFLMP